MIQLNKKTSILWVIISLFAMGLMLQSCDDEDDGIRGCTDPESTNFDALAEVDDESCMYNSDRFFGIYLGDLDCEENALIELSNDSTTLEITQGVYSTRDSVTLTISAGPNFPPLSVAGSISDNTLRVEDTINGIPFPVLGEIVFLDVSTDATVTLSEDNEILSGPLTLNAILTESGADFITSDCNYSGVKQ